MKILFGFDAYDQIAEVEISANFIVEGDIVSKLGATDREIEESVYGHARVLEEQFGAHDGAGFPFDGNIVRIGFTSEDIVGEDFDKAVEGWRQFFQGDGSAEGCVSPAFTNEEINMGMGLTSSEIFETIKNKVPRNGPNI